MSRYAEVQISAAAEQALIAALAAGERGAEDRLARAFRPLALYLARAWARRLVDARIDPAGYFHRGDVVESAATDGLLSALRSFDPTRGCRFATHLRWRVLSALHAASRVERRQTRAATADDGEAWNAERLLAAPTSIESQAAAREALRRLGVPPELLAEVAGEEVDDLPPTDRRRRPVSTELLAAVAAAPGRPASKAQLRRERRRLRGETRRAA